MSHQPDANSTFRFDRQGRSRATLLAVAAIYAALISAVVLLDAALWLIGLLVLPTLPALWDLWRNPQSGLTLTTERLDWWSGQRNAGVTFAELDHMRFDTRLDFSVRVSAVLDTGKKIRLPQECLPHHRVLEAEFRIRGVQVERHHFSLL